jgi:AraC-like DNA-binding protein
LVVSSTQRFSSPEEVEAAHVGATAKIVATRAEPYEARLTRIEFGRLWIYSSSETSPRVRTVTQRTDRAFIKFLARPGPDLVVDGAMLPFGAIVRHRPGHEYYERSHGELQQAGMSLPIEDWATIASVMAGCDPAGPRDTEVLTPAPAAMERLLRLHATVAALAELTPEVVGVPEAARAIEQSLIESMAGCLSTAEPGDERWAGQCHRLVMERFRRLVETNPDRPLYIPEICAAIHVPERTLRACCLEYLGMGPKEFLTRQRMHLARRELLVSAPSCTSVTDVATRFGFFQLGRFAGVYRSMFGESPSATLHRRPA